MTNPMTDEVIDKAVDLLPCPFCGEAPKYKIWSDNNYHCVGCESCGYEFDYLANVEEVIDAWNTRAAAKVIESALAGDRRDADRYRWLRDVSRPEHGMFYLSVWAGLHQVKWTPEKVDETIDDAMKRDAAIKGKSHE